MKNSILVLSAALLLSSAYLSVKAQTNSGKSPITQPFSYLRNGKFTGPSVPESPDPLVNYRWNNPLAEDSLEIYLEMPKEVRADKPESFKNLQSLVGKNPDVLVQGTGSIRIDFGLEMGAWVEFDSPDCTGDIEMSISEYNEPGVDKTAVPVKHGNTYRLELNPELYDGVRFAWIHVKSFSGSWHITGIRAVCQIKPTNYNGSFDCSDPVLTKAWYMSAYGVKASLCQDYFGAILMERGDRMSWTGDAHTSQAAALVAFGNSDFIRKNIENTSGQDNGIRSYSLYWVLSLLDYYHYTGDGATLDQFTGNAISKLDAAYQVFGTNPGLRFYGWDERLCAGFEIWFRESPEAQNAYKMLSIRSWQDFADAMGKHGRNDLKDKYERYAAEKLAQLRNDPAWYTGYGLHAAADGINTGLLNSFEQNSLYNKRFTDRVNCLSISPFNQYFILQSMARMGHYDEALTTVRDMWGGMVEYGGTTPFETYRPSWNRIIGTNDAVPNTQSGITSLCHPWGAGVVKWLNEEILGIVPTKPGFKTWEILPHPGRTLTRVSGSTPTPYGAISASYDLARGKCEFSIPVGTMGKIGIPKMEKSINKIAINGKAVWIKEGRPKAGTTTVEEDDEFIYLTDVQAGNYLIRINYSGETPAYEAPPELYEGEFIGTDSTTGGNWGGRYGSDGYVLCNYYGEGKDQTLLPTYVKSVYYYRAFPKSGMPDPSLWAEGISDTRALAADAKNGMPRNAGGYTNSDQTMTVTIGTNGTKDFQVALYFVDWKRLGSRQAVEMFDAETLNLIAPVKLVKNHAGGAYLVYRYNKSVKFRIDKIRGGNISLSGIFFD